ncbi:MAG TPA: tripartite tricarboxylate transporter substrate binding protein [Xanthobacteraceae bacterium]|nr:tripartite tricarboxylate transporter substrate binding protein [Xanthobacteraceae bacterium]
MTVAIRKASSLPIKIVGAMLALLAPTLSATAQEYPAKPIRLVIPFPPGGSNDVVGRLVAQQLSDRLGKQVVVDNRGGAGGVLGTEMVANSPHDGYTLLIISIAHAVSPWLYKLNYDPIKSFVPVAILASGPNVLVVHPDLPVHSVAELIALAKRKPGELNYASAGIGSFQHLGGELFKLIAGVNIVHVPYKGGGPALTDVLGGYTKIMFSSTVQTVPFIHNGQLRALGTGGAHRSAALPDVPTIGEQLPGYEATNWWGVLAPAGTPPAIVAKLHDEIAAVQNSEQTKKQFAVEGADVVQMSSAEFGTFIENETKKWERVVKESGIKAE